MITSRKEKAEAGSIRPGLSSESGFSLTELLIAVAMIIILTAIAVFSLSSHKKAYSTDDQATQVLSFFREAYHRALSQRQTMRVDIDVPTNQVLLTDEGLLPGGDEVKLLRGSLDTEIKFDRPVINGSPIATPPAPYNYSPAAFDSEGVFSARFRADGSVLDNAGNLFNATIYFSPDPYRDFDANLIRAVTLYGPTGSIKYWRYDAATNTFIAENR